MSCCDLAFEGIFFPGFLLLVILCRKIDVSGKINPYIKAEPGGIVERRLCIWIGLSDFFLFSESE